MLFLEDVLSVSNKAIHVLNRWLLILFTVAIGAMALTTPDPLARDALCASGFCLASSNPEFWNSLLHTLASGTVLSVLFYWMLVEVPRYRKRERLKRSFVARYRSFKLQCIDIFLVLSKSPCDHQTAVRLLEPSEFRHFFKEDTGDHQNRWHRFLNGLNDYYLEALARKMEHQRDEFKLFLLSIESEDEELVGLLHRFADSTFYHVTRSDDYDEVKALGGYFWELFAGWNFIEGYRKEDLILEAIRKA